MIKHCFALFCSLIFFSTMSQAAELDSLLVVADVSKGQQLSITCQACHAIEKNGPAKLGPNLYNVVGRKIASTERYDYSPALSSLNDAWNYENLDKLLTNPQNFAPGSKMVFAGIAQAGNRAAVIAWLRLQSDKPVPLPIVSNDARFKAEALTSELDPNLALLPAGPGREEVFYTCSTCHSIKLVIQQGLDRDDWDETLDWMVEEQAMDALSEQQRNLILDYLSTYLGTEHSN